jgi:hypothetical protein
MIWSAVDVYFTDPWQAKLHSSLGALTSQLGPDRARAVSAHLAQLDTAHDLAELALLPGVYLSIGDDGHEVHFQAGNLTVTGTVERSDTPSADEWTFVITDIAVGIRKAERNAP